MNVDCPGSDSAGVREWAAAVDSPAFDAENTGKQSLWASALRNWYDLHYRQINQGQNAAGECDRCDEAREDSGSDAKRDSAQ